MTARSRRRTTPLVVVALLVILVLGAAAPSATAAPTPTPGSASASTTTAGAAPSGTGTTGAVPPATNATFGLQPVTNGRVDSRAAFTYQTGPGGSYTDAFAVVNYAPNPVTLQVYAADLDNNDAGGLVVGAASDPHRDGSAWLRLPAGLDAVTLPAASGGPSLQQIPFGWVVPTSAAAGDHFAALVASLTTQSTGADGQPVRLEQRVALRVFFRVSGTIDARLEVQDLRIVFSGPWSPTGRGQARVSYTLHNTGNVRLGARQQVTTSAALGGGGTPAAVADQPLLLPGASVRVVDTVRDIVPGFRLSAAVHVEPVRAEDDVNVSPRAVDATASTWAVPWALLAALLLAVLLLGALTLWWRRRLRRRPASRHGRGRGGPSGRGGSGGPSGPDGPDGPDGLDGPTAPGGSDDERATPLAVTVGRS